MSYLNYPRLIFSGTCIADPSTVNNTPSNYGQHFDDPNPSWNPNGTGNFKFQCIVTQVIYQDGSVANTPAEDPVIGMSFNTNDIPWPGKIVDLDPQQQMVSELWGVRVILGVAGSANSFQGDYAVAPFINIWQNWAEGRSDDRFCAYYQSQLQNIAWGNLNSKYLTELKAATYGNTLSIKFNLDSFQDDSNQENFTTCRIVGAIGPVSSADEPSLFPLARCLRSSATSQFNVSPALNYAYCVVDAANSMIALDMGNSIGIQGVWQPSIDMTTLQLAVFPADSGPIVLGNINYSSTSTTPYTQTAYIQNFTLSAANLALVQKSPLGIIDSSSNVLLQENQAGTFIRAEPYVFRMNAGNTATVQLVATQFGKPMANATIKLASFLDNFGPPVLNPVAPHTPNKFGTPQAALPFPASVTTDANGIASFTLKASDPGNPRYFLDGQLYGISYYINDSAEENPGCSGNFISVQVYQDTQFEPPVTWTNGMQAIFNQYGVIYPIMGGVASFINLSDYTSVYSNKDQIKVALTLDMNNPNHMPVTRDLSQSKLAAMIAWIENDCPH